MKKPLSLFLLALLLIPIQAFAWGNNGVASRITSPLPVANGGTCGTGTVRTPTSNDTLVLADCGNVVVPTLGTAITETIPPHSSVAFPLNATVTIVQGGAGALSFAAGWSACGTTYGGVTINCASTTTWTGQNRAVSCSQYPVIDTWNCVGALQ